MGALLEEPRSSASGGVEQLPALSTGTYGFTLGINANGAVVGEYGGRAVLWP